MTTTGKAMITEYLGGAQAAEEGWGALLKSHIAITPSGRYRSGLERLRNESGRHAQQIKARLAEVDRSASDRGVIGTGVAAISGAFGQAVAVTRAPLALLRGGSGEEKLVHNAIEQSAVLQHTIAAHRVLSGIADAVGDDVTADMINSIITAKEDSVPVLHDALPGLVASLVRAEVEGKSSYEPGRTGAAQQAKDLVETGKKAVDAGKDAVRDQASEAASGARSEAKRARKVPGVAQAEGAIKGAAADEGDLAISDYDDLTAAEVIGHLPSLSQIDLAKVGAYEAKHDNRSTVTDRVETLTGSEPWPGYDELTVGEIAKVLAAADSDTIKSTGENERRHKDRRGVLDAVDKVSA
jgi:hypothetical protein